MGSDFDLTNPSNVKIFGLIFAVFMGYVLHAHRQFSRGEQSEPLGRSSQKDTESQSSKPNDNQSRKPSSEVTQEIQALERKGSLKSEITDFAPQVQLKHRNPMIPKFLREDTPAAWRQSADHVLSTVTMDLSVCDKREKLVGDSHGTCKDTIRAFKNSMESMRASFTFDLDESKKAHAYCQKQLEAHTTKSAKQDTQLRALQNVLSETRNKLQGSQATNSAHELRQKELNQKFAASALQSNAIKRQLDESKATAQQLHSEVWPLRNERARLQAEISSIRASQDEKSDKISDLKRLRQEHASEIADLETKLATLEEQRSKAAIRAESWRMKWEALKDGQDRAIMYSDPSGDLTMIDAPGNPMKVDIPWVRKAGEENIELRLKIEDLTKDLEEAKAAVKQSGQAACNNASDYQLQLEATKQELSTVKKELEVTVRDHLSMVRDIQIDPTNRYHPIYRKIQGLEHENNTLKGQLMEAKALSWDRRSSMVP